MTLPGMVRLMNMTEEHGRHLQRVRALFQRLLDERGYVVAATACEWRVGDRLTGLREAKAGGLSGAPEGPQGEARKAQQAQQEKEGGIDAAIAGRT